MSSVREDIKSTSIPNGRWVKPRSHAEVGAFFDGPDLVEPGVVRCPEWRPDQPEDAAGRPTMWGGVARKS